MNPVVKTLTGMSKMTDEIIAMDLLMASKSQINNYAIAITETATPEVRAVLKNHLNDAIVQHEKIIEYMINREYHHPRDLEAQEKLNLEATDTALKLIK